MTELLCIGGPWNGERVEYTGMPSLVVPIYNDVCPVFDATIFPTDDSKINLAHYRIETFREKHGEEIKVWVAEGVESVLKMLLESYEGLHVRGRYSRTATPTPGEGRL